MKHRSEAERRAGKARELPPLLAFERPVVSGDGHVSVGMAEIRSGSLHNAGT